MKVLVVDDSNAIRTKLARFLGELGHEVVGEASNGIEAVSEYRRLLPDFVTMDIVMPECDGISALNQILEVNPKAVIYMITSAATVSNMYEAKEAGAAGFLIKPFVKEKIAEMVKEIERRIQEMAA